MSDLTCDLLRHLVTEQNPHLHPLPLPHPPLCYTPQTMPSWPYAGFEPQIHYLPQTDTWRCLVRRLPDGEFRALGASQTSTYPTPDPALSAAIDRVAELLAARKEALAVEVERLLTTTPARLKSQIVQDPETNTPLKYWIAQSDAGVWTAPQPTPREAVRIALNRLDNNS